VQKVAQGLLYNIIATPENFSVTYRLSRKNGFSHVLQAENISDKCFKIFFVCNRENNARLGIIASKKTFPKAVERNNVKRKIRETFRRHNIKIRKLDIVVMVLRSYPRQYAVQSGNLEMLFSRLENKCVE